MKISDFRNDHFFLSNFSAHPTAFEGIVFPSSEAAYQAAKTTDLNLRNGFVFFGPGEAKRRGRKMSLRQGWDDMRIDVMRQILVDKFTRNRILRWKLMSLKDCELVEGNTWGDTFWGVCRGRGQNNLGKLLMEIRDSFLSDINDPAKTTDCCNIIYKDIVGHNIINAEAFSFNKSRSRLERVFHVSCENHSHLMAFDDQIFQEDENKFITIYPNGVETFYEDNGRHKARSASYVPEEDCWNLFEPDVQRHRSVNSKLEAAYWVATGNDLPIKLDDSYLDSQV